MTPPKKITFTKAKTQSINPACYPCTFISVEWLKEWIKENQSVSSALGKTALVDQLLKAIEEP